ncbi:hypothetical protein TanjilG_10851 [Lupinus angustifolius]|uniref:Uncharacterized protein n=1 Tax=Lupinus angustifolius TaxID=3871 RepID=A0A1J7G3X7_LUPAN|nr:PREDICTED: rubisco accumulation factor 1.1, chloroplastic-like [Lupinus angustifolius]OIV95031.1 hypothetical protein TanjilG_10851 [Lupinus angustifolius]
MLSLSVNSSCSFVISNSYKPWSNSGKLSLNPSPYIPADSQQQQQQHQQQQFHQSYKAPPSPLPSQLASLDTPSRLQILSDRLGLWHQYTPLIPFLLNQGFSPPSIEEQTGISAIQQNRLVVAAQVRDSLIQSNTDPEVVSFFDIGGEQLLYEIRLLSAKQRASAAEFIVQNDLDVNGAQELARAIKDFPSRKDEKGRENFDYTLPGDCLAFMCYRQSREHDINSSQRNAALERALSVAQTHKAKIAVSQELNE